MKGIILAGGLGQRLYPLTKVTNKHLLPIYKKPMIFYPLTTLVEAGIKEVLIISGPNHMGDLFELLGSGKEFGCDLTYRVQDTAGGLPHAIAVGEKFAGKEKFCVINGDNIIVESIKKFVQEFEKGSEDNRIFLAHVSKEEAQAAGVAEFNEKEEIIGFEEKPTEPKSNWIAIGLYMYKPEVFEVIRTLKPSARGELEITDLHKHYLKKRTLAASKLSKGWADAGTFDDLVNANKFLQQLENENFFRGNENIHSKRK